MAVVYGSFAEVAVVTVWGRRLGWFLVMLINLFFVYFSVLKTSQRSKSWQYQYVAACVVQFISEVFIFESITVLWVHWVIPRLISRDVRGVINSLRALLNTSLTNPVDWKHPFDTTSHFFVSKAIALKHPHLLESTIVLSFHSYLPPGRMSTHWATSAMLNGKRARGLTWFFRIVSLSLFVIGLLHMIGTLDMNFQTFIMSLVLPIALVAAFVVVNVILQNVIVLAVVIGILFCLVVRHFLMNAKHKNTVENQDEAMIIIPSVAHDNIDVGSSHRPSLDSHVTVDEWHEGAKQSKRGLQRASSDAVGQRKERKLWSGREFLDDSGSDDGMDEGSWVESAPRVGREISGGMGGGGDVSADMFMETDMQLKNIDSSSACGDGDSQSDCDIEVRVRAVRANSMENDDYEVSSDDEGINAGEIRPPSLIPPTKHDIYGGGVDYCGVRSMDSTPPPRSSRLNGSDDLDSDVSTIMDSLPQGEQMVIEECDASSSDTAGGVAAIDGSDSDSDI